MIEISKIGVLGAGIMGSGIAQVAAQAGYQVTIRDIEDKFIESGFDLIKKSLGIIQSKGKITQDQANEVLARIKGTTDFKEAVSDVNLVIEAVPEDLDLKKQIFKELD